MEMHSYFEGSSGGLSQASCQRPPSTSLSSVRLALCTGYTDPVHQIKGRTSLSVSLLISVQSSPQIPERKRLNFKSLKCFRLPDSEWA